MKIKIPKINLVKCDGPGNPLLGQDFGPKHNPCYKGNTFAKKENMSPESHARRMAGLQKTYEIQRRKAAGERVPMPVRKKNHLIRKKRIRLHAKMVKELREIQEIARRNAEDAMNRCIEIMNEPSATHMVQLAAAQVVLERGYGKANQTNTNVNVDANGKENEVTAGELDQRVAQALKRVEALTGGAPKKKARERLPPDLRKCDGNPGGGALH